MLVLGRKPGEYVMIGDDIMVKVVRSDTGNLRLAIDAPETTTITRGELYQNQNNSLTMNTHQSHING
ncbi:carbon storage regulator [Desulfosporosinus sp. Sb-LF]|uniref:carbon storage regulator n=1 Tax=Desulfosporosinus sp. Sb-LF TaxID=2560027 RepID=UPI00107EFEB1|nr:carbon storage regulator [Desulfosporosinus sp. Sb-LF]TGE32597.1 carbon storage regulator [Desulfosporosinus sp. Sb-LF]